MKKTARIILLAFALVINLTQCTKNNEINTLGEGEIVHITLNVSKGNGSRLDVDPPHVNFENGDVIHVASNGVYVGDLEYNGTNFEGEISNATEGQPLYFYLLGNVTPSETLIAGTTTTCSVNISDQTGDLPVIACAPSDQCFGTTNNFTATLRNKCALVKFNVTTVSSVATCITGFNNKVTVNFSDNTMISSQENDGVITLPAGNGEKWAILLPQGALGVGSVNSAYSVDGECMGTRGAVPAVTDNGYLTGGVEVVVYATYVDLDLPSGTLWANCNVGADTPEGYGDHFHWGGTNGSRCGDWSCYEHCEVYYVWNPESGNADGDEYYTLIKYCFDNGSTGGGTFGLGEIDNLTTLLPEDDASVANWGTNWRMPSIEDWQELYQNTTNQWVTQNGVNGRLFTASNGNSIFLPAAGWISMSGPMNFGSVGDYWSNSLSTFDPWQAKSFGFGSSYCGTGTATRNIGKSIRAVRSMSQN